MLNKVKILDVEITNESNDIILEYLLQRLKKPHKFYIVTPNPELLVIADKHKNYTTILNSAEISLADGTGLFLASIILGKPLKQRIPGADFMEYICKNLTEVPLSIGFLGGRPQVAERVVERLLKKYPFLKISFVGEEWDEKGFNWKHKSLHNNGQPGIRNQGINDLNNKKISENNKSLSQTHNSKTIDLLFVAFGSPKQEEWIYKNLDHIPVKAAMGVGGTFDFIAGEVTRAPRIVRFIGFEWLYRLIRQPWRWRRQLSLLTFVKLVLKERFYRN